MTRNFSLPMLAAVLFAPAALPSTIVGPFTSSGGSLAGLVLTPSPDNHATLSGPSPNMLLLAENFSSLSFTAGLNLTQSGASTAYLVTKTVTNSTSFTWDTFTIGLGCGSTGTAFCGLTPLYLTVDNGSTTPAPTSTAGTLNSSLPLSLQWIGLNLAPGQSATFTFSVDTCAQCTSPWQIQQTATGTAAAPEPGSILLGSVGLSLAGLCRLWKRRAAR